MALNQKLATHDYSRTFPAIILTQVRIQGDYSLKSTQCSIVYTEKIHSWYDHTFFVRDKRYAMVFYE